MTDARKEDYEEVKARATAAKALLEDKAFQWAVLELRKRWFAEFLKSATDVELRSMQAKINALEALATELAIQINDYKMAAKRHS
jgi:hypothetical protein